MKRVSAAILFLLLLSLKAIGQECFKPWDADVAVADETVTGTSSFQTCHNGMACCEQPQSDNGVYDAFTGGALLFIRAFQIWISPQDGPSCRFRPTCSAYGKIAVQKHGAFLGAILVGDRILRCNPFSKPRDDPVPDIIFNR